MSHPSSAADTAAHSTVPNTATAQSDELHLDPRRWLALLVIGVSQLMVVLDATITNVAIPTAAADLGLQQSDIQWVITSYALPFGSLLLLGGRIADYLGRKRVLLAALVGFALASIIGGAATQAWMMFAGRALQGVFAAMLAPAALSLVTVTFLEAKERAKAFAVMGAIAGGGAAIGLLLGGAMTQYLSTDGIAGWRWCFFVNIPIAVFAAIAGSRVLRESRSTERGHYDLPGAVVATLGLAALVWGFTRPTQIRDGKQVGWASFETIGWIGGAIVLLALFVFIESRSTNPLLPLRIVENRNRTAAYIVGMLVGAGMFAVFLFMTLYLQNFKHYSPMKTGLAFLPFSAGIVLGAGVGSQLVLKVGPRWVIAAGAALGATGLTLFSRLNLETTTFVGSILPAELTMAFGMGFIFMATTNLALVGIAPNDAGVASAVFNTTQQIGGSLGTALLSTVAFTSAAGFIDTKTAELAAQLPPGMTPEDAMKMPGAKEAMQTLVNQATVHGFDTGFLWAAAIFVVAFLVAVLVINVEPADLPAEVPVHVG